MQVKYCKLMKKLHNLAGEIGTLGETNEAYAGVYAKLSDALDIAEYEGLITYTDDEEFGVDELLTRGYLYDTKKLKPIVKELTRIKKCIKKEKRG